MLVHVVLDVCPLSPAVVFYFVSSEMDVLIVKGSIHIAQNIAEDLHSKWKGWIELPFV